MRVSVLTFSCLVPTAAPTPRAGTDTDNGVGVKLNADCAEYASFPSWCPLRQLWNDQDFTASDMGCACGVDQTACADSDHSATDANVQNGESYASEPSWYSSARLHDNHFYCVGHVSCLRDGGVSTETLLTAVLNLVNPPSRRVVLVAAASSPALSIHLVGRTIRLVRRPVMYRMKLRSVRKYLTGCTSASSGSRRNRTEHHVLLDVGWMGCTLWGGGRATH